MKIRENEKTKLLKQFIFGVCCVRFSSTVSFLFRREEKREERREKRGEQHIHSLQ
jgi:hypothetical protein